MRGNTVTMELKEHITCRTATLWQYDYGQILKFTNAELPDVYEVHFSNEENGESLTMIGDENGVDIPDELLQTGKNIYVWLYLHAGDSDGETEFYGLIPVMGRSAKTDYEPTPVQQDVITQTIAALNAARNAAAGSASSASAAAAQATQQAQQIEEDVDEIMSALNSIQEQIGDIGPLLAAI